MPFTVPEKWKWVRVSDVACINPKVIATDSNINVFFIPMAAVSAGYLNKISLEEDRPWETVKNGYTKFANGDVLIAKITPCFQNRKSAIANNLTSGTGCGSSEFHVLRSNASILDREYLLLFVKSAWFIAYGIENFKGTAGQQRLGTTELKNCRFPLPPISEQRRIVAKTKKLFEQIDRAEKAYKELSGPLSERFRQLCLEKAIQGKLVPQLESEPSVEQLGQAPESVPFSIPQKWKWVQLRDIASSNVGLTYKPEDISIIGTPILRSCNIENGEVVFTDLKRISKVDIPTKCLIHEGDILMCSRNGSKSLVGKCALMSKTEEVYGFGAFMTIIRSPYNRYLKFFFESDYFRKTMLEANNTTSINQITQKKLLDVYIPLPPIGEQLRIVTRVNEIISEIKRLRD